MKAVLNYFKFILLLSLISYNAFADPPAFDIVSVVPASPSCNGGSNGSITVTITPGGTPNYTYTFFKFVVPVPWVPVGVVGPNGNLSATLGGLDAGFYMVIVQDNSGNDPRTGFCTITQPTALTLTVNSTTNITCNGANNGSITATAGGATPSYTYTLLKGGVPVASNGTGSFPNLVPGNDYVVSVTDLLGCGPVNSAIQTITEPAVLNASIASTNITCFGGNNGTITLSSPSGGYGTYGYSINGGGTWQASGTFNSLTAGSYNVQIRDAANPTCIIVLNAALTLTQPAVLNAAVAKTDVTICFGNNNGSITISGPSGGSGNYEYTINGGASWQASGTYNSLTAGTYNVQIRDANVTTCVIILNAALTINQPVVLNASVASTNVTCFGGNNGSITISSPSGGSGSYEYSINGGGTWQASGTFNTLTVGSYNVQIRDAANPTCVIVLNAALNITQLAVLNATVASTNVTCFGGNNGSITISSPLGGSGTYEYSINGGGTWQASGTFNSLIAGSYNVQIRDAANPTCVIVLNAALNITQLAVLNATVASTNVTCFGGNNGSITISSPSGGSGSYEYSINGGGTWQASGTFNSLTAGSYDVQIRDAGNPTCVVVLNAALNITQLAVLNATVASTNVTCNGGNNGSITISSPSGGSGTYEYSINGGGTWQASGTYNSLTAGSYNVQIRDAGNPTCVVVLNAALNITQLAVLNATVASTNVTCFGGNNGSITISGPSGGSGTYEYSINGGGAWQASGTYNSLTAGSYNVQIRDAGNPTCVVVLNAALNITQPAVLSATVSKTDVTGCNGNTNGTITISSPSGGSGQYQYTINGGTSWQNSGSYPGLGAGTYNVQIRDRNAPACVVILNAALVITQPAALTATLVITNVTCFGANNGSIQFTNPLGGSGSYGYSIDGGSNWTTNPIFTNLTPGTYNCRIRNLIAPYCTTVINPAVVITQPTQLNATISSTNVSCFGGNDGTITFSGPSGGSGTYEYTINGGTSWQASGNFTLLIAGTYNLRIRDAAVPTCVRILNAAFNLTQPAQMNATVNSSNVTCFGGSNGTITISSPTGGSGNYEYTINGGTSWQASGTFNGLVVGSYNIQMRDASATACIRILNLNLLITQPAVLNATISSSNITCFGGSDGTITLSSPTGGSGNYEYSINGGTTWQASPNFTGLLPGSYNIQIRDANDPSCFIVLNPNLTLTQPVVLNATVNKNDVTICFGNNNGSILITLPSGGSGSYEYTIDGGTSWQASGTFNSLTAGTYNVQIRDANAPTCFIVLNSALVITEPAQLQATVNSTNVNCNGGTNGSITISGPLGGSGNYEYTINGGTTWQASGTFNALTAGTYNVQIRDANNITCIEILNAALTITEPAILAAVVNSTNITCFGNTDGTITISGPTGGSGAYEYSINGGTSWENSGTYLNLGAATYTVMIRDANVITCVQVLNMALIITAPTQLNATVNSTNITCNGANDGSITISGATGGYGNYEYTIDGGISWQASGSYTNLAAGNYDVRIRDLDYPACSRILNAALPITEPAILAAVVNSSDITCNGANDGSITITGPTGGWGTYEYTINGGTSWFGSGTFTNLAAGNYDVRIRDAANPTCLVTLNGNLVIIDPDLLTFTTNVGTVSCNGTSTGTITINASGGTPPYEYSDDNGVNYFSNGGIFSGLAAGTYDIWVRDAKGCTSYAPVTVTEPSPLVIDEIRWTDVTCFGDNNGTIKIILSGGTTPYSYSIDGGATYFSTDSFSNLTPNLLPYEIAALDANNCVAAAALGVSTTIPILEYPVIHGISLDIDSVTCPGASDGRINYTATGGKPSLQYAIDGGPFVVAVSGLFAGLPGGNHIVSVLDNNNCRFDTTIFVFEPASIQITGYTKQDITCNGDGNGEIHVTATGGSLLKYQLIDGNTNVLLRENKTVSDFLNLIAGFYKVVAADSLNSCNSDTTVVIQITEPALLQITQIDTSNYVCFGNNDGFIRFHTVIGGTRPYRYSIDNGTTWQVADSSFTGLSAITYNLVVEDINNCQATFPVAVTLKLANQIFIDSIVPTHINTCQNDPVGKLRVYASGGNSMLEFSLTGNNNDYHADSTFTGLVGGTYNVYVRDTLTKCLSSATATVIAPTAIVIDSIKHTNVQGLTKGTVTVYAKGGAAPLGYSLDNVTFQASNIFTNLDVGKYYVYVNDSRGCTAPKDSVTISSFSVHVAIQNVLCKGDNTGAITITVNPADTTYHYSITGAAPYQDSGKFVNLAAGAYHVQVIQQVGAPFDSIVNVTEPAIAMPDIIVSPTNPDGPYCQIGNSGNNGTIWILPYGFQYSIDGGISWQANTHFLSLTAGVYNIVVKDTNGCQKTKKDTLINPNPIKPSILVTNVHGSVPGSIRIFQVYYGTPPFRFSINGGLTWRTDSLFTGLSGGIYYTITTQSTFNYCSQDTAIFVGIDPLLPVQVVAADSLIKCHGDSLGEIKIALLDSIHTAFRVEYKIHGPVKDSVNSKNASVKFSKLPAGIYIVTVIDSLGVTYNEVDTLFEPPLLTLSGSITGPLCNVNANSTGSIDVTTNGGILPYNWIWSNKAITEDLLNIPLGLYSVSVTDKNKCKASASFDVQAQYWVTANAGNDSTVCPYTQFQLNGRGKSSDGGILIYNWVDLLTNSTVALSEKPVMYLPPIANRDSSTHTYILSVYNQMSCFATDTVKIKVAPVHGLKIGAHLPYEFAIRDTVSVGYMLPLQLEALPDSFVKYTWSPAVYIDDTSSRTPTVTLPEWALYTVRAITREGCAETSYIGIDVAGRIIVPTGFTPNGDDKNEFWEIDNAEYYPNIVVQVFNRWGEKVYESKGYNNDDIKFDGKRNGRNLPSGTYYYIITIDKKIESKGPVTIIR